MARGVCAFAFEGGLREGFCACALSLAPHFLIAAFSLGVAESKPPHVIFFLSDDLGWSNVNFHNERAYTPTLDKLRSSGIELTRHYACESCAKSLYCCLTCLYRQILLAHPVLLLVGEASSAR